MQRSSVVKVGVVVLTALVVLLLGVFLVGQEQSIFRSKNDYIIRFTSVSGLSTGNPVQLDGVQVGSVQDVILPEDPSISEIEVQITVDRRFADRVRSNSMARIKTLGLLGDKYVEITSGSPQAPRIEDGGEIPTAPATSVDELMSSGEDVITNVTAITFSLRNILERMERGEGLVGKLLGDSPTNERLTDSLVSTLEATNRLVESLNSGGGPVPRLIHDEELTAKIDSSLTRLDRVLASVEEGEGLLPGLLNDPASRQQFDQLMARLDSTLTNIESLSKDLSEGDGLLAKLTGDEAYSRKISGDLEKLLENLRNVSDKLNEGEGTVSKLLNDPQIYQSLNDILIGIDESWMLRTLIRNRQQKGIETRYDGTTGDDPEAEDAPQ